MPVVIENPIINAPFEEPRRHFAFDENGITNVIVPERRVSSYFIPVARAKRRRMRQQELGFDEWTQDRVEECVLVNRLRGRVGMWRAGGGESIGSAEFRRSAPWLRLKC